jgi:hypothetical protein
MNKRFLRTVTSVSLLVLGSGQFSAFGSDLNNNNNNETPEAYNARMQARVAPGAAESAVVELDFSAQTNRTLLLARMRAIDEQSQIARLQLDDVRSRSDNPLETDQQDAEKILRCLEELDGEKETLKDELKFADAFPETGGIAHLPTTQVKVLSDHVNELSATEIFPFATLPRDLQLLILKSQHSVQDVGRMVQVCQAWNGTFADESVRALAVRDDIMRSREICFARSGTFRLAYDLPAAAERDTLMFRAYKAMKTQVLVNTKMGLPKYFDSLRYIGQYLDIAARVAAMTPDQQIVWVQDHYRNNGRKEGRSYGIFPGFEGHSYMNLHPEIEAANGGLMPHVLRVNFALDHYLENGIVQGLRHLGGPGSLIYPGGINFDPTRYLELNPDLNALAGETLANRIAFAQRHYFEEGRAAGRLFE